MTAPGGGSVILCTPGRSEKEATVAGIARDELKIFNNIYADAFASDPLVGHADPAVIIIPGRDGLGQDASLFQSPPEVWRGIDTLEVVIR